jgi:hypothetical protein
MQLDDLTQLIQTTVTHYLAFGVLISIAVWALAMLVFGRSSARQVRDCATYFVIISVLVLVLTLLPHHALSGFDPWEPLIWFCFTMLLIFELFWAAYIIEGVVRAFVGLLPSHNRLMETDINGVPIPPRWAQRPPQA